MLYLLDTNILIRSKNEMPMDIWLTFWARMQEMMAAGQVFSSVKVKDEFERGADELTSWMRNHAPKGFYLSLDEEVMEQYANAQAWVQSNPVYKDTAKLDFANVADAYLVATAAAKGMTLVTYEISDPACKRRVKIPDVCNALGVPFCDLNAVLRDLGVTI